MASFSDMLTPSPQQGGLDASNRPNPYGLRAYKNADGSWGGDMMPKWTGWLDVQQNTGKPGYVSTELSVGDSKGDFPTMVPTLSAEQVQRLLALPEDTKVPEDIYKAALDFANKRRSQGLSPFKDLGD